MIPSIGVTEMIVILAIVVSLFGARRIPSLARSLGAGLREFRNSVSNKNEDSAQARELSPDESARSGQEV